ncbi:MAG: hypothetical protein QOD83_3701 [Solirubrobacteraceae bacterium]|nr:hypothetical protein [Solirubrobacteraceae bacterium]
MESLDQLLTAHIASLEAVSSEDTTTTTARDGATGQDWALSLEEIRIRARDINDADLTYLFMAEPLSDEVPLMAALSNWLRASLSATGMGTLSGRTLVDKCEKAARSRFKVAVAEDNAEATWMRRFLALETDSAVRESIEDLRTMSTTLQGWLDDQAASPVAPDAWAEYRETIVGLPDMSATMYSESFGVSKVFQTPIINYHVASARGDAGQPHRITDVGRLLGALASNRTQGQDLIVLSGGPGSGKSTLCRVFASELAQTAETYPVFLQLRRVKEGAEISQFIEASLQSRGLVTRISDLLTLRNVVIILDGFDELVAANRSRLRQFFNALLDEIQTGPLRNARVIVSGRDTLFPGGQGLPPGSHVLALQPLDRVRVEAWGARWRSQHASGPGCTFHPEAFLPAPKDASSHRAASSPLEHLVTWPLTLHLVARVHTAGGLPEIDDAGVPIDKAYLYRSILAETSVRQAHQVAGKGRLEPDAMRMFLRSVAWLMYTRSVDSLDVADVTPLLDACRHEDSGLDSGQLAEVAVLNAPELAKGEETGFEFVHKSFAEFLVAEEIAEQVERASFLVPEFGSREPAWRMSAAEASGALAGVLGIRLLPEEIQEMMEPMLGSVLAFRAGRGVEDTVAFEDRRAGLQDLLRRCEGLYASALSGIDDMRRLEDLAVRAPAVSSALDVLANYVVGLALVGCAAVGQLMGAAAAGRPRAAFNGDPGAGGMWRFLAIAQAGGISIDERLGGRLFAHMTARGPATKEVLADTSVPWKLYVLASVDGYRAEVADAAEDAVRATLAMEHLILALTLQLSDVLRTLRSESVYDGDRARHVHMTREIFDRRDMSLSDAMYHLIDVLGRMGAVGPKSARDWNLSARHEREEMLHSFRAASTGADATRREKHHVSFVLERVFSGLGRSRPNMRAFDMIIDVLMEADAFVRFGDGRGGGDSAGRPM